MKLVTLNSANGGDPAVLFDDNIVNLACASVYFGSNGALPGSVAGILANGPNDLGEAARIADRVLQRISAEGDDMAANGVIVDPASAELLAPVPRPGIVLSHARAYRSHQEEMRGSDAEPEKVPTGFIKNTNSVIGPGAPIVLPASHPDMVDFEGEFSVVIGRPCHHISPDEAMDYVAGYTIINDISARDWVAEMHATGDKETNRLGKQFPTFCPLGPVVATPDEVPDPHAVRMRTTLNGKIMQDASTSDLIWGIPEIVAHYAQWYPFEPGDVISTGTPAGVGHGQNPPVYMKPGDVVAVTVDGVGTLENPVVAPSS